jgi:hypothetical protein
MTYPVTVFHLTYYHLNYAASVLSRSKAPNVRTRKSVGSLHARALRYYLDDEQLAVMTIVQRLSSVMPATIDK